MYSIFNYAKMYIVRNFNKKLNKLNDIYFFKVKLTQNTNKFKIKKLSNKNRKN